jgi:hypothetical protein
MATPSPQLIAKFDADAQALYARAGEEAAAADNIEAGLSKVADDTRAVEAQLADAEALVERLRAQRDAGRRQYEQDTQRALGHRRAAAAMRVDAEYLTETAARARRPAGPLMAIEAPPAPVDVAQARQRLDAGALLADDEYPTCPHCGGRIAHDHQGWYHLSTGHNFCDPAKTGADDPRAVPPMAPVEVAAGPVEAPPAAPAEPVEDGAPFRPEGATK